MNTRRMPDFKSAFTNVSALIKREIVQGKKTFVLFVKLILTFLNMGNDRHQPLKVRLILLSTNSQTTSFQTHLLRVFINRLVCCLDKTDILEVKLLNFLAKRRRNCPKTHGYEFQIKQKDDAKFLIIAHLFYEELFPDFLKLIKKLDTRKFDLCVTVPEENQNLRALIEGEDLVHTILPVKNLGRDIRPFLLALNRVNIDQYKCILKVHTKKSPHMPHGDKWRSELWNQLMGSQHVVDYALELFDKHLSVGMIGPCGFREQDRIECNFLHYFRLCRKLGLRSYKLDYYSGSMFWIRPEVIRGLIDLESKGFCFSHTDRIDGNLEHAIERIFGALCYSSNLTILDL